MKITNRSMVVSAALVLMTGSFNVSAQPFSGHFAGTSFSSADTDINGDLEGGNRSVVTGNGTFGSSYSAGQGDLLPWDNASYCDFDETGLPRGLELTYFANAGVSTYKNGDQLYTVQSTSPPSTLCFNYTDGTSSYEIYRDVVGGSGRFEGASGTGKLTGSAIPVQQGFSAIKGETTGEINGLAGKGKKE